MDWLEDLGCTVHGAEWLAEFEVKDAAVTTKGGREGMKTELSELVGR